MESLCFVILLLFPITVSAQSTALNDASKTESQTLASISESNGSPVTADVTGLTLVSAVRASEASGTPLPSVVSAGSSLQPSIAIPLETATGGSVATVNSPVPTVIATGTGSTSSIAPSTLEVQISAASPQERSNTVDSRGNSVALSTVLSLVTSSPGTASDGPQPSAVSLLIQTDVTSGSSQPSSVSPSVTATQKVRRKRAAPKRKTRKPHGSKRP